MAACARALLGDDEAGGSQLLGLMARQNQQEFQVQNTVWHNILQKPSNQKPSSWDLLNSIQPLFTKNFRYLKVEGFRKNLIP